MAAECAAGRDIHKGRRRLLDTLKFHKPSVLHDKRSKGNPILPVGVHVSATLSKQIVSWEDGKSLIPPHSHQTWIPSLTCEKSDILCQNQKLAVQEWCICGVMCFTVNTDKPAVYSAVTVGWEFTDVNETAWLRQRSRGWGGHIEEVWTMVDIHSTGNDISPQLSGLWYIISAFAVVSYSWQLSCPEVSVQLKVQVHEQNVKFWSFTAKQRCSILLNNLSAWGLVLKGKQKQPYEHKIAPYSSPGILAVSGYPGWQIDLKRHQGMGVSR